MRFELNSMRAWLAGAVLALALLAHPLTAAAQFTDPTQGIGVRPELLKEVGVDQKLNDEIPLNLAFRDEHGRPVELAQFFGSKPVILTLVYYNCPMLCTQVLNGLDRSLETIPMEIGKDFNVVTVSIDPTDRPVIAEAKQAMYAGMYRRPGAQYGWHFLTGDEPQIKQLADAVGFRYAYDPDSKQYAHASAIMLLTPEGKISRYFYGVSYPGARFAPGSGGGVGRKDWFAGRSGFAFLLPLRSPHRKIRPADFAGAAVGGTRNGLDRRDFSDCAFPGRALRASPTQSVDRARRARRA